MCNAAKGTKHAFDLENIWVTATRMRIQNSSYQVKERMTEHLRGQAGLWARIEAQRQEGSAHLAGGL